MKINKIKQIINDYWCDHEIMLADGFDDALVGVGWAFDKSPSAVYDRDPLWEYPRMAKILYL